MMKFTKYLLPIFVFLILVEGVASGMPQIFSRDPIQRQFNRGVDAYNDQEFERALQLFRDLNNSNSANPLTTATSLMIVKSYYRLGLYRQSLQYGKEFLEKFPQSSYVDDIYFSMAEAYLRLHQYINGAYYFSYAITQSQDETLSRIALESLLKTTDVFLTDDEVQALVDGALNRQESHIYRLCLLQEYVLSGEMSLASTTAMELERASLRDILQPTFQAFKKAISLESNKQIAIGVIAPLSGGFAEYGKELLLGARYALSQRPELKNISIIPLDNRRSGIETVHQLERAGTHDRIIAVIGPIWSENVVAGASTAGMYSLPLITPTGTNNGIANLNEFVFQLSPDYETRGKATAQFAVDSLHLKNFAIMGPADQQGKSLTDAFTAEVEARGGDVVSQVWYSGIPEDLTEQFEHLREVGFQLREQYGDGLDSSLIIPDSIRATLPDSEYAALFQQELEEYKEDIDSTEITLKHIDGMYFPIRSGEIDYVVNQLAFHNFDTQVLGNVEWYDEEKLQEFSGLMDSLLIFSDYYIPNNDREYSQFVSDFRQQTNTSPTQLTLYGYDTMNLILDLLETSVNTRASFADSLSNIPRYEGIARVLSLYDLKPRVNQAVQVLRFIRQYLEKVDVLTVGSRKEHPMQTILSE